LLCGVSPSFAQEAKSRQVIHDAIDAANSQLRLEIGRAHVKAHQRTPEELKRQEDENTAYIHRLRDKWSGTIYRWTFDGDYERALKDPVYRYQALAEYDSNPGWGRDLPSLSLGSPWDILGYVIAGIVLFFVTGSLWARFTRGRPMPVPPQPKPDTTFGSADWAPPQEAPPNEDYILNGVFFGKSSLPEYAETPLEEHLGGPVCGEKKRHSIICAQTRTGKGTRVIVPTLLKAYPQDSMLIIDPKGENAAVTARARKALPSDVHIINPWGELAKLFQKYGFPPATYNPLDILDRNDKNVVSVAQSISAAICPPEPGGKNPFWNRNAADILTAVLLWLTETPGETKTLGRAREIITRSKKQFETDFLVHMAASTAFGGAISENASRFIGMAQETYSGIMSNLQQYTSFLSDQQVKAATASSSFSMQDLVTKPTTVYVVVPPDKLAMQRTWLRLLITAGMQTYKHHGSSTVKRCMFLIDELPALGRIDELPTDIATMAGYGVDFVLIVQALDQLRDVYGDKGYGAILSNCAYKWFCNVSDLHTADYLSKTLGNRTVQTMGKSTSINMSGSGGSSGTSTSYGQAARALLAPDEILNLGRNTAILLSPGSKPQNLRTVDYWDLAKAFGHLEKQYPSMYWKPKLTWDPNPFPH